jgi:hypothetical protein
LFDIFLCVDYIIFFIHSRGSAIKFLGTERHHDKWLVNTENYVIKGCFAMTELGHGSNVCVAVVYCVSILDRIISITILLKFCFTTPFAKRCEESRQ